MQDTLFRFDLEHFTGTVRILLLSTVLILFHGCGAETYEKRLNETSKYFAYVDTRNQALSGFWSSPTIKMRVPLEFQQMEAPKNPVASASDESESPAPEPAPTIDPRQPDYADLVLPGLEGAWRAEVPVDQEQDRVEHPAYLYVLSNQSLLKEKREKEALDFFNSVNNQIAHTFDQFLNPEIFKSERYPKGKGYSNPKSFLVGTFVPEMPINGVPYQFQIYLSESGNQQVVILLVIPQNIARASKLKEQMDYSLETVEIIPSASQAPSESAKF
ncbi:hypothetical protein Mal35_25560 [Gimesia maris]|uniref:hypothetical protein n=1 Tax=Gimesia maris TaxID=122 RepID=UPI001188181A|nr:hypothetical protein [Gimesia maris]QDT79102.1 hypothetical protein Mal35_25560 [Gimesia maris]